MTDVRRIPAVVAIAAIAAIAAASVRPGSAEAEPVRLSDGDSFMLGHARYRLYGIDAPELHQDCTDASGKAWPCGRRARSELRRIIGTHPVECQIRTTDRFGRYVATCKAAGRDLAQEMVRAGYATASVRTGFSGPYDGAEQEARRDRRGIWAGTFDMPQEWRRKNPREDAAAGRMSNPRDWLSQTLAEAGQTLSRWLDAMLGR